MFLRLIIFALGTILFAACSSDNASDAGIDGGTTSDLGTGDADVVVPDAETPDSGSDPFACDPSIQRIEGGGVGGGRVRGQLTVFVQASESGDPLPGATIVAQFGGDELSATTRDDGCVAFRDPRLGGAARIHAFAADRVYLSLVGFNAAVATVNLARSVSLAEPEPATITGGVGGWDVLTASTATVARLGFVEAIPSDVFAVQPEQTVRPENMNVGSNVVVVGRSGALDFRTYSLRADARTTVGVAIRAGSIQFPRFGSPTVELTHEGYLLGIDADPGAMLQAGDVQITHPLTETMTISYGSSGRLPSFVALGYVVMPGGIGWFYEGGVDRRDPSNMAVLDLIPRLDGVLAGATYGAAVQASNDTAFSLAVEPGTSSPHVDVGDLPEVPTNITANGRSISALVNSTNRELVFFGVRSRGQPLWTIAFVNAVAEPAITLPVPPEGYTDPLSGRLDLSVLRIRYADVRLDDFSFSELSDHQIRSFAGDIASVTF